MLLSLWVCNVEIGISVESNYHRDAKISMIIEALLKAKFYVKPKWPGRQAVRQGSAKPLYAGAIPAQASNNL